MANGFVHTVLRDGRWRSYVEGEQGWLTGAYLGKETAVVAGALEARRRRTEHLIYDENGKLSERQSYSINRSSKAA
jgi:hypothetical protein